MKDLQKREQFIELRSAGKSYADIAETLGLSKTTLIAWSKQYRSEIANMTSIALDALQRKHQLNVESRVELFGTIMARVKDELGRRDLSAVSTEKLLDMIPKFAACFAAQCKELHFIQSKDPVFEPDHVEWRG